MLNALTMRGLEREYLALLKASRLGNQKQRQRQEYFHSVALAAHLAACGKKNAKRVIRKFRLSQEVANPVAFWRATVTTAEQRTFGNLKQAFWRQRP